jgi:predicted lactoylglutathione lyase
MEITSFYPLITAKDYEGIKATYEALGFKVAHTITDSADELKDSHKLIVMKNDKDFRLVIFADPNLNPSIPHSATWMNVRDFDAAVALFKEHGYTAFTPEHELEFLKVIAMKAPDGHIVVVVYHKREHDED